MGGAGNKDDGFSKMPQMKRVTRDEESYYTSLGSYDDAYKDKYLGNGEQIAIRCDKNDQSVEITASKHFEGFDLVYRYNYNVTTKQLQETLEFYGEMKSKVRSTEDLDQILLITEAEGVTEMDLIKYKKYFLYDKFITDWLAVNNSRFSVDDWGKVKFIEELPSVNILNDNE